jgi:endonuclease V-like protein UPF0215 family
MHIHELDSSGFIETHRSWKEGIRVLGVAESFQRSNSHSIAVGVVMRGDMRIDGVSFCQPTVGGMDATERMIEMFDRLNRDDIRVWMLGGCIISWFNVVNATQLNEHTGVPVVCVSYHPSEGIVKYIKEYFPSDWKVRVSNMDQGGERKEFTLDTGHQVFITSSGIALKEAHRLVNRFTLDGRVPEPIRVARIAAGALGRDIAL